MPQGEGLCDRPGRHGQGVRGGMRQVTSRRMRIRRWRPTAAALAAVLGTVTILAAGTVPAAAAAGAHKAPAASNSYGQGKVRDRTCQNRSNGVLTCEWLYEWPHTVAMYSHTTLVEAFASMKSSHNMQITEIQLYWSRCVNALRSCPPQPGTPTSGSYEPGGYGTIQGHGPSWPCNSQTLGFRPTFRYKYFLSKPANEWIFGTANGAWQWRTGSCAALYTQS